jgi:hypothetical protein
MVGFTVEYDGGTPFEQYAGINVLASGGAAPGDNRSRPKMIVSAYSVEPNIVPAGTQFDLSLSFQNANATRAVSNVKVTLEAMDYTERRGAVFTPVGGSNTFYIDAIEPKGVVDRQLRMFAVPDADPRTYSLRVTFEYEDDDFNPYTEVELVNINVKQNSRLETSEIYIPTYSMMYQPVFMYFNIINSGRVSLTNLRVRVEGNFDTVKETYVGNLGRGNSIYYQGDFTPMEPGEQPGAVVVWGEDDTGTIVEMRYDFSIYVEDAFPGDPGGIWIDDPMGRPFPGEPGMEETGFWASVLNFFKNPVVWAVGGVVVAGGVATTVILVRRARLKRGLDFDE